MLSLGSDISSRVHIHLLHDLVKPANLPFHLLEFTSNYIRKVNRCLREIGAQDIRKCNTFFTDFVDEHKASGRLSFRGGLVISYVYYTESDQIVRFKDLSTRNAVLGATNMTTMIIGRRQEKHWKSSPEEYMKGLIPTRAVCGEGLYALDWPASSHIRKVSAQEFELRNKGKLAGPVKGINDPERDMN